VSPDTTPPQEGIGLKDKSADAAIRRPDAEAPSPRRPFLSPLNRRRLAIFRAHKRGYWSMWIFLALFAVCLFAEFIANDRPLVVRFDGKWYFPVLADYSEDTFGDTFLPTDADYTDPDVVAAIDARGWMLWPLLPYSYQTTMKRMDQPAPSPPSWRNPLGTDDEARDVLARVVYGFRISVLFGFTLTAVASAVGIAAGAVQGFVRRQGRPSLPAFHRAVV